jgi:tripartite-type tricarboxylate transporter receptor subunit TctC
MTAFASRALRRRTLLAALGGAFTLAGAAHAQAPAPAFPSQPIRIVVPFSTGGTTDLLARLVAEGLRTRLGQNVIVENKAGAGGNIGAAEVARAAPDGHTLLMATPGPLAINQYAYASTGFDAEKQFTAVANVALVPNVLMASTKSGLKTVPELIARAKAAPGKLNYGSAGNGSSSHLAVELLKSLAGVELQHIPYKGVAPAMTDLLAGQIEVMVDNLPTAMPMIESGKVVALGVTVAERVPTLPNVPPIAQTLPGYEVGSWFGLVAPTGTPPAAIRRIAGALDDFLKQPETRAAIAKMGAVPDGGSPEKFAALIKSEQAKFRDIVRRAKIRVE